MSLLGLEGAYENELAATGEFNPQAPKTALMLPSGQRIVLPTDLLLQAMSGVAQSTEVIPAEPIDTQGSASSPATGVAQMETVIPLIAEEMQVGKQVRETAHVRIRRETEERVQTVNVALTDVRWEVEHIPVEQKIEQVPSIRQVGETTIFPLVEERLVVSRELWLREEVHVRRMETVVEKFAEFPVKRDVLVEQRTDAQGTPAQEGETKP